MATTPRASIPHGLGSISYSVRIMKFLCFSIIPLCLSVTLPSVYLVGEALGKVVLMEWIDIGLSFNYKQIIHETKPRHPALLLVDIRLGTKNAWVEQKRTTSA